jgi:hypothetical protein
MKTRFADAALTLWLPRCLEPAGGIWATTHDVIHYGRIHVDSRTTTGMANVASVNNLLQMRRGSA